MEQKTCVFIGGKQIGVNCLRSLLQTGVRPSLVVSNADDQGNITWHESLVRLAVEANLPLVRGAKIKEPKIVEQIREISPQIIFCIGATQIIPPEVLAIPPQGTVNLHPALLPKYRGRYSTAHAIANGEVKTGVTLHFMDAGIDSGPIVMQRAFDIGPNDTAKTVWDKFTETGTELFKTFLDFWIAGKEIVAYAQDETQATYFPKGLPGGGEIDWSWSGQKIYDFIRSLTFEPFPPASFMIGDKKMVIVDEKYFKGFN